MTDETTQGAGAPEADATADQQVPDTILGLVTDGAHALIDRPTR